jgi:hypothetical protein
MTKNFSVYYHIWSPPGTDLWKLMVDEQLKRLMKSGILKYANVKCGISGPQAFEIVNFVSLYDWVEIIEVILDESQYEGLTLKYLYNECLENDNLKGVMYFHTKGISHLCNTREVYSHRRFRAINSWRHFMEWGTIDRWKEATELLTTYDVSGVNYCLDPWPHMSGNFWWASPKYIKTLINPVNGVYPDDHRDFGPKPRMVYEKWIGLNNPKCFSFYNAPSSYDHKNLQPDTSPLNDEPHWFWLYRDDIEPYYRGGNK